MMCVSYSAGIFSVLAASIFPLPGFQIHMDCFLAVEASNIGLMVSLSFVIVWNSNGIPG